MTTTDLDPDWQKAIDIAEAANKAYDRIRRNSNLSDAGKRAQIARPYLAARKAMNEHIQARDKAIADLRSTLQRRAAGVPSDPAGAMSYRQATQMAEQLKDPAMAKYRLEGALASGDDLYARAIGQQALDQGWATIYQQFLDAKPEVAEAASQLQQLVNRENDPHYVGMRGLYHQVPAPPELDRLGDAQIDELAATPPQAFQ